MDGGEFGPMEPTDLGADVVSLKNQVKEHKAKEQQLLQEKITLEHDFGQKRAKFIELYKQQKDTLDEKDAAFQSAVEENQKLVQLVKQLRTEIDDVKTAVAYAESSRIEEIEEMRRKYQDEVASYQQLMTAAADEASDSTSVKYEKERAVLINMNQKLNEEVEELRRRQGSDAGEGFFSSVTQKLKSRVHGATGSLNVSSDSENLEESMKKAKLDSDTLKSVIVPLETEIEALKKKLKKAHVKINNLEGQMSDESSPGGAGSPVEKKHSVLDDDSLNPDEKLRELNKYLVAEKSSRTDLEMFVAVLNTQKQVLADDNDMLRKQLHEVCTLLEKEQKLHNDLKLTWQMANDQFLESQRLNMMDMRRMESVLSEEQQRQIAELQKKDIEREEQEKKVRKLEQKRHEQQERQRAESFLLVEAESQNTVLQRTTNTSLPHSTSTEPIFNIAESVGNMKKSASSSQLDGHSLGGFSDSGVHETRSLNEECFITLTDAQQKALRDPTPEKMESDTLLASIKSIPDPSYSPSTGRRLVSDKEWNMLQEELNTSRAKLGRPCDMCKNYEDQLQQLQTDMKQKADQVRVLERQVAEERDTNSNHVKYTEELETSLKNAAEDAQAQITSLASKIIEAENSVAEVTQLYSHSKSESQAEMKKLSGRREEIQKELTRLQDENDSLVGKHSKTAQELQTEDINLPTNMEDMQLYLLRYREEIITAKVAKMHLEEQLRSEILFYKDQVVAEQQEKNTIEEELNREISHLQDDTVRLQSVLSELERETKVRQEYESKYKESQSEKAKSKLLMSGLKSQVEEQSKARTKLESDLYQAKSKITALQIDLDNNEAVQRDFVKLSQSLQIQLEKIRQGENEVRWQHEEDVEDCNTCHSSFSVTKRKHHCRHCGKIFCSDCTSKTVYSGPNMRMSRVCDVCHTILVKDATPYFSTEAPDS